MHDLLCGSLICNKLFFCRAEKNGGDTVDLYRISLRVQFLSKNSQDLILKNVNFEKNEIFKM